MFTVANPECDYNSVTVAGPLTTIESNMVTLYHMVYFIQYTKINY